MGLRRSGVWMLVALLAGACVADEAKLAERRDAARDRLWVLTKSGVVVHEAGRTRRVPLPGWTFAGARYGCAPELALGPAGEAIVTSDVLPVLWRVDPASFAATRHELALDADRDKDLGFVALAFDRGSWTAISTVDGAAWSIDGALTKARKTGRGSFAEACSAARRRL